MDTSKATPRPWVVMPYGDESLRIQGDHRLIAVVQDHDRTRLVATAELICRAGNAYDELVAACQTALASLRREGEEVYKCGSVLDNILVSAITHAAGQDAIPAVGSNRDWATQAILVHDELVAACEWLANLDMAVLDVHGFTSGLLLAGSERARVALAKAVKP